MMFRRNIVKPNLPVKVALAALCAGLTSASNVMDGATVSILVPPNTYASNLIDAVFNNYISLGWGYSGSDLDIPLGTAEYILILKEPI